MKKDVLKELPEKIENTMYADLTPYQKQMTYRIWQRQKTKPLAALFGGRQRKNTHFVAAYAAQTDMLSPVAV